jgi:hypothetical protein
VYLTALRCFMAAACVGGEAFGTGGVAMQSAYLPVGCGRDRTVGILIRLRLIAVELLRGMRTSLERLYYKSLVG